MQILLIKDAEAGGMDGGTDGWMDEHSHVGIGPSLQLHAELILSGFRPVDLNRVFNGNRDVKSDTFAVTCACM